MLLLKPKVVDSHRYEVSQGRCKQQQQQVMTDSNRGIHLNICRPCGTSRSECGYCHGSRFTVLIQCNEYAVPPENEKDSNQVLSSSSSSAATVAATGPVVIHDVTTTTTTESYNVYFDSLTVDMYQTLINRGWRRSGTLLYRPHNWNICCPLIPIRLHVMEFQKSKSQRRIWNRFQLIFNHPSNTKIGIHDKSSEMDMHTQKQSNNNKKKKKKEEEEVENSKGMKQKLQDILKQMNIVQQLQEIIYQILQNILPKYMEYSNVPNDQQQPQQQHQQLVLQPSTLQTLCTVKLIHGTPMDIHTIPSLQIESSSLMTYEYSSAYECILSTCVCSALHGMTQGTISKHTLGQDIITQLLQHLFLKQMHPTRIPCRVDIPGTNHNTSASWMVKDIQQEEKSGQIHIRGILFIYYHYVSSRDDMVHESTHGNLITSSSSSTAITTSSSSPFVVVVDDSTTDSNHTSTMKHIEENHDDNNDDQQPQNHHVLFSKNYEMIQAIQTFISTYPNYTLATSSGKNNMNNKVEFNQEGPRSTHESSSTYQLCVESIPPWISCRQVEVHHLFARYQAAIHGDINPYDIIVPPPTLTKEKNDTDHHEASSKKRPMEEEEEEDDDTCNNITTQEVDDDDNVYDRIHQDSMLTKEDFMTTFPHYTMDQIKNIWKR